LQTIDRQLTPIAQRLACSLSYLGEETEYRDWLNENLNKSIFQRVRPPERFFSDGDNIIRVIVDGIDGTVNFTRGIPLFCSAAAILIDDQLRVSAIYDPIHQMVYSACLQGPYENPADRVVAWIWQIAAGYRLNLIQISEEVQRHEVQRNRKGAIGIHLTRSDKNKLHDFLQAHPLDSKLERLAMISGGIYAYNAGIIAMADVARGALGGFVNNTTNMWDVAAGEVLVRACGGKVSDFAGLPINYSSKTKTSVIAAKAPLYSDIMGILGV
jgi:fructose-1,6-bisphosphatase/inositol monophosphatase family enzyme